MKILSVLLFALSFGYSFSQETHTIFTDSIKLVQDGDTILWKKCPQVFFINSTRDTTIDLYSDSYLTIKHHISFPKLKKVTVYDDSGQKLRKVEYGAYPSTSTEVFINGQLERFKYGSRELNIIDDYTDSTNREWYNYKDERKEHMNFLLGLKYTYTRGAPLDTMNYEHNQKEGKWEFVSYGKYAITNYKNNMMSGLEVIYQKNKLRIESFYEDDVFIRKKVFDMKRQEYLADPLD